MSKKLIVNTYRPIEGYWYKLADYVQHRYYRHVAGPVARIAGSPFAKWFRIMARITWRLTVIILRITFKVIVWSCIVGFAIVYICGSFAMGQGKLAKSLGK